MPSLFADISRQNYQQGNDASVADGFIDVTANRTNKTAETRN
jgi:hypothetical protein